jgi:hypothetical protein
VIPRDTNTAIAALTGPIEDILTRNAKGIPFQNPLTDYFGVPLSSFTSAFGLARGYFHNLVKPVVGVSLPMAMNNNPGTSATLLP